MIIKDCVCNMLVRLGLEKEYDCDNIDSISDDNIDMMIKCINMVISEIASDYIPIRYIEKVMANSGVIDYDDLSKRLIKVVSVMSSDSKVDWHIYPEYIKVNVIGECVIDYCYLPNSVDINSNILLPPQITQELLSCGAMAEFCLIMGRYEDSMIYDKRFRESLKEACRNKKEVVIKSRRW